MSLEILKAEEENKKVLINPLEVFPSKQTPIFASEVVDVNTGESVGAVEFQLNNLTREIIIQSVLLIKKRQGYGEALYKCIQFTYPSYRLISSDQMNARSSENQEKSNAKYLWEKLVRKGIAEKDETGRFKMIKSK